MRINIRFHLFLCLIGLVIGAGEAWLFSQTSSTLYMEEIYTFSIWDALAPMILMSGMVNGYYLFFNWIRVREFNGKSIMGALMAFIGFPIIVFLGVLSLVPLWIVDFYQMFLKKRDSYKISTMGGGHIIKMDDEALAFEEIHDITCKEKIHQYNKMINQLKAFLLFIFLGLNILCWMIFQNDVLSFVVAMVSIVLYRIIFMLEMHSYMEHMVQDLLYEQCDPYRMTLIMDHLLDHHKIETMFGEYLLMVSLREQDNNERIHDLIQHKNTYLNNANLRVVYHYASMDKLEREAYFPQFYEEDKAAIHTYVEKHPKYQEGAQKLLISLDVDKHIHNKEYDKALTLLESISMNTTLDTVRLLSKQAYCYYMIQNLEKAEVLFDEIIDKGNSTCYVEAAREYLEKIHNEKG